MKNLFWFDREQVHEKKNFILRPHRDQAERMQLPESVRAEIDRAALHFAKGEILLATRGALPASIQFGKAELKFAQVPGYEQSAVVCAARRASALVELKRRDEALTFIYWWPVRIHEQAERPDAALQAARRTIHRLTPPQTVTQRKCLVATRMTEGKILAFRDDFEGALASIDAGLELLERPDDKDAVKSRAQLEQVKAMLLRRL